jgi:hypothetical protein
MYLCNVAVHGVRGVSTLFYKQAEIGVRGLGFQTMGRSGVAAAGMGTGGSGCRNGPGVVAVVEVGSPLTICRKKKSFKKRTESVWTYLSLKKNKKQKTKN